MEYYHLPWVHPGLVKVSPMQAHRRWQGDGMYTGMCTSPYLLVRHDVCEHPAHQSAIDELAAFWDSVNREDIEIVQRVQRGLERTPFPGGPMCYRFEESIHGFQNMVIDRMVGLDRQPAAPARLSPHGRITAGGVTR